MPRIQLLGLVKPPLFPCPLHKIIPRRRTMRIVKSMKEIATEVEIASAFPGSISGICPVCPPVTI
jgi:hypothetical protein